MAYNCYVAMRSGTDCCSSLDGQTAEEIEQLLFALNKELGTTLVLVTHDQNLAALCQRHVKLVDGQIQEIVKLEEGR